uniref:prolyl 3-hydroxylase OGFOD1 isoform X2 n=1 Tax=Myxine glutinosa TaxID=7769 RepID=UPI00358FD91D
MGRKRSGEAREDPQPKVSRLRVPGPGHAPAPAPGPGPGHATLRVYNHAKAVRDAFGSKGLCVPDEGLEVDCHPFHHCVISNFLEAEGDFFENLQNELLSLPFRHKSNDLYKFQQSDDLGKIQEPCISALRQILYEDFRFWLSDVFGVTLETTVDMFCSKYEHTDVLLCHDDELEGRRVAYILYMVPPWTREDGGQLQLFNVDAHLNPTDIAKSLVPTMNTLIFFEVSPVSYHQVAEVLSQNKCRLSVGGWFHGPTLPRPPRQPESTLSLCSPVTSHGWILEEWVSPVYFRASTQVAIRKRFQRDSEIQLHDFLRSDKFELICGAMHNAQIVWEPCGPPNHRCYEKAVESDVPDVLRSLLHLLHSSVMFDLLARLTGLKLGTGMAMEEMRPLESKERILDVDVEKSAMKVFRSPHDDSVEPSSADDVNTLKRMQNNNFTTQKVTRSKENSSESSPPELQEAPAGEYLVSGTCEVEPKDQQLFEESSNDEQFDEETTSDSETSETSDSDHETSKTIGAPACCGEVRRWRHGAYTLLHDGEGTNSDFALDLILYTSCPDWPSDFGGFTSYVARDEDEELLTILPKNNALALVYRDRETLKFVKHVNHRCVVSCKVENAMQNNPSLTFHDISFVYYE